MNIVTPEKGLQRQVCNASTSSKELYGSRKFQSWSELFTNAYSRQRRLIDFLQTRARSHVSVKFYWALMQDDKLGALCGMEATGSSNSQPNSHTEGEINEVGGDFGAAC